MHLIAGGHRDGAQIEKLLNARRRDGDRNSWSGGAHGAGVQASVIAALQDQRVCLQEPGLLTHLPCVGLSAEHTGLPLGFARRESQPSKPRNWGNKDKAGLRAPGPVKGQGPGSELGKAWRQPSGRKDCPRDKCRNQETPGWALGLSLGTRLRHPASESAESDPTGACRRTCLAGGSSFSSAGRLLSSQLSRITVARSLFIAGGERLVLRAGLVHLSHVAHLQAVHRQLLLGISRLQATTGTCPWN